MDLAANYFNIYDRPYLTSAVLGAGVLSRLSLPYHAAPIFGFVAGLFVPTGMLNNHFDKAVAPVSGALHGYSYAKNYGAAAGFASGVVDEVLHNFNITSQYWFSTMTRDIAISNLMLPTIPSVANAVPVGKLKDIPVAFTKKLIEAKYVKEFFGFAYALYDSYTAKLPEKWLPIQLSKDMQEIYSDIMDKKQLQKTIDNQAIAVVTVSLITQNLIVGLADHYQGTNSCFEDFKDEIKKDETWQNFKQKLKDVSVFLPAYVVGIMSIQMINAFFSTKLQHLVNDIITQEITSNETILQLTNSNSENNTDANTLIKRKVEDVATLTSQGSHLLSNALSSVIKGSFSINYLISVNAQNILVYSMCYSILTNALSAKLSIKSGSYDVIITKLYDKKTSLEEYLRVNADSIIQRNSNDFIQAQLHKVEHDLRTTVGEQLMWSTLNDMYSTAQSISDFIVNYLMTSYHLHIGAIDFNVRFKVIFMNNDIKPMISWSGQNAGEIVSINQAMDRLNELKARMRSDDSLGAKSLPVYSYQIKQENSTWLCFDDLTVGAGDKTLMQINHQCIDDNIIAVTGESHSGKSTLLKLVKGLQHSVACGNGAITFYTDNGCQPNIIMVSQHYNMPPYITLLELITLKPYEKAKAMKSQVEALMREIGIDSDKKEDSVSLVSLLNEEKDWDQYITSGGARKKLMAIWVITEKPDVAILDEIFVGLDRKAIEKVQNMFREHLPETKFLIVDHEAASHNFNGFYQNNLYVNNKTIILQDFSIHSGENNEDSSAQQSLDISNDYMGICPIEGFDDIFSLWR